MPTFLCVATEWFSHHGGLSTINRNLCIELAAAGCTVFCYVPSFSAEDGRAAGASGVTLLANPAIPGLVDEARLIRRPPVPEDRRIDFVVGHGHITGPAAASLSEDFFKSARRIHFFHTAPEEIAPLKASGASARTDQRVQMELDLASSATLTVAVGPRLESEWLTQMSGRRDRRPCYQLLPWITSGSEVVSEPPPIPLCLVLGRTEDYHVKGLDIAARSVGLIASTPSAGRTVLVVRGVQGDEGLLRQQLIADAGAPALELRLRGYTPDEERLQEDIRSASILLMPSRADGFGLVGLEALSHGIPVLVSSCSGLGVHLSKIGNGAEAMVVRTTGVLEVDAPAWRESISRVLSDRGAAFRRAADVRSRLLASGQQVVRAFLDYLARFFPPGRDVPSPADPSDPDFGDVAALAPVQPSVAMLSAFARLEGEVRRLAERIAPVPEGLSGRSVEQSIDVLAKHHAVATGDTDQLQRMSEARDRIVLGTAKVNATTDVAAQFVDDARRLHQHLQLRTIPPDFIRLDRQVIDLAEESDEDLEIRVARSLSFQAVGLESSLMSWDKLLAGSRHAVVLGEPGAGKTWELRALAVDRSRDTERAYFVRLELLLDAPELALHGVDLSSDGGLLLLLDALDESKLRSVHALERCLRALEVHAGAAWSRVRVVLSCRVSDWQPRADGETLARLLPPAPSPDQFENFVRVVGLAPLTDTQISRLAAARGVKAPDTFLGELSAAGARELCARPRDVIDLVEFWTRHGRVGRLGELLEDNVSRRLAQPDARNEPVALSLDEARQGAEDLAAALALGRSLTVLVPDEVVDPGRRAGAIDPAQALPGWDPRKIRTLLSRPIFDEATLGRVRVHHRTTADYLAACWVRRLLSRGCERQRIESLFVGERLGRQVVFNSMVPVAAWLASWDPGILALLAERAPETLMQAGDPQGLPVEFRAQLLKEFARSNRDKVRVPRAHDWATLARFAHPDLAETIIELLRENRSNADLALELVRVAVAGKVAGCVDIATEFALDSSQDEWVRRSAIDLITEVGSPLALERLREYLETGEGINRRVLYRLWGGLFPRTLTVPALLGSIRRSLATLAEDPTSDSIYVLDHEVVPQCPQHQLEPLLTGLTTICRDAPSGQARARILDAVGLVVLRLFRESPANRLPIAAALAAIDLIDEIDRRDGETRCELMNRASLSDIRDATALHPGLRREFFLQRVSPGSRLTSLTLSPIGLLPQDLDWLLPAVRDASNPRRTESFTAICALIKPSTLEFEHVREAVKDSVELTTRLDSLALPPPPPVPSGYEREAEERRRRELEVLESSRVQMLECIDEIRVGTHLNALYWLVNRYGHLTPRAELKWDQLQSEMGNELSEAARSGLSHAWQGLEIPARGDCGNRIPQAVVMGLIGAAYFFQDRSAQELSPDAARTACRLATWELNRLPEWSSELLEKNADVVREIFLEAIRSDLWGPDDNGLLGHVAHGPPEVLAVIAPHIIDLLASKETEARSSLRSALRVVLDRPSDSSRLRRVVQQRIERSSGDAQFLWILAGFAVDAEATLNYIQGATTRDSVKTASFLIEFLSYVRRSALPLPEHADIYRPATLGRFIELIYRFIRPAEDESPEGPHSPSSREQAQHQRSSLLQALGQQTSEEAHAALVKLAKSEHVTEPSTREWIDEMAQRVAERLAQGVPWTPGQVVEFARACAPDVEPKPKTTSPSSAAKRARPPRGRPTTKRPDTHKKPTPSLTMAPAMPATEKPPARPASKKPVSKKPVSKKPARKKPDSRKPPAKPLTNKAATKRRRPDQP